MLTREQRVLPLGICLVISVVVVVVRYFGHSSTLSFGTASTSKPYQQIDPAKQDVHSQLWSSSTRPSENCLSANSEMRHLVASADQIILVMPPKAAGTTFKGFATRCNDESYKRLDDNFLNHPLYLKKVVTHSLDMPGVAASHVYRAENLVRLLENLPRNSLLVYAHREETSRLISAIAHVAKRVCHEKGADAVCTLAEKDLVDLITSRRDEIGNSGVLTCDAYKAIESNRPNMILMDYKHALQLQNLVAEKLCPNLVGEAIRENAGEKSNQIRVQSGTGINVTIKDWLQRKSSMLELSLGMNVNKTCMGRTRMMEDQLFSCPDGFLNVKEIVGTMP